MIFLTRKSTTSVKVYLLTPWVCESKIGWSVTSVKTCSSITTAWIRFLNQQGSVTVCKFASQTGSGLNEQWCASKCEHPANGETILESIRKLHARKPTQNPEQNREPAHRLLTFRCFHFVTGYPAYEGWRTRHVGKTPLVQLGSLIQIIYRSFSNEWHSSAYTRDPRERFEQTNCFRTKVFWSTNLLCCFSTTRFTSKRF